MGRSWVLLIRTFLWLSAELPLSRGDGPARSLSTGTLARVLATVPPTPTLGFLLFRWFHLGLTAGCDYGGYGPPCVGAFDPDFPLAFCWIAALSRGWPLPRSLSTGTLARVLATVPLHTYSWLSLISVVSSGAD